MIVKHVITTIWCDAEGCMASREVEQPVYVALKEAVANGWQRRARGGPVKEFCPRHALGGGDHAE